MSAIVSLLALLLVAPAESSTHLLPGRQDPQTKQTELTRKLQTKLDQIVAAEKFPGATLGVSLEDGSLVELASGFADLESKVPLRVGDRMFCGSTGKTFVSAIALKLVAEGKLDLDQLAAQYFESPEDREWFAKLPNASELTIRSLMNHTSGLPRYLFQADYLADLKENPMKSRSPKDGLSVLQGVKPTHPVGKGWAYSDSNYVLLGMIIERVTGKKFYDLTEEQLLTPLGLSNTLPSTQPKLAGLVQGYVGSVNFFGLPRKTLVNGAYAMNPDFEWCGGGFITTAGDLATWLRGLHSGNVIDSKLHQQLVAPVAFQTGQPSDTGYGLGSFVWKSDLGFFYGHAGIMPGYLTQIEYSKDHRFAIALQTNTDEGLGRQHHRLVQEIAKVIVDHQNQ